ncbi:MAG: DUF4097 domain-containing protein [Phycisphaerales bacterium JB040]
MTRAAGLFLVAPVALLGACGHSSWNQSYHHAHMIPLDPPPGAHHVTLSTNFGDLDVAEVGQPAPSWATKHHGSQAPERAYLLAVASSQDEERPALVEFETRWTDAGFTVEERWPGGRREKRGEGVGYVVRLPEIAGATVLTDFGDIEVSGATGVVRCESSFGDVKVYAIDAPEAVIVTDHGDIDVYRIAGPATLESDFGDIRGEHLAGVVEARTAHGDIDLILTPDNPGPFVAVTDFGDVHVQAGKALTGSLDMDTDFGNTRFIGYSGSGQTLRVGGKDNASVRLGEGGKSQALTSHGDVRVTVSTDDDSL